MEGDLAVRDEEFQCLPEPSAADIASKEVVDLRARLLSLAAQDGEHTISNRVAGEVAEDEPHRRVDVIPQGQCRFQMYPTDRRVTVEQGVEQAQAQDLGGGAGR